MASLDRTWCDFWRDCPNANWCDRRYTDEIRDQAIKLGIPVSHFLEPPECHKEGAKEATDAK